MSEDVHISETISATISVGNSQAFIKNGESEIYVSGISDEEPLSLERLNSFIAEIQKLSESCESHAKRTVQREVES